MDKKTGNRIMLNQRSCIYSKDVQRITGKSERAARYLLRRIKNWFHKKDNQYITADEFAEFTGINKDLVREYLKD